MASASLSRATSDPQSSNTTATFSVWLKRNGLGSDQTFWGGSYYSTDNMFILKFSSDDKLQVYSKRGASVKASLKTTRVLKDISAWYHIVIGIDTTQASAADRIKVYINGVQETLFSTNTQPSQDENLYLDSGAGANYYIGQRGGNAEYFDGQMAHFHYADGTTYTPTTFGETDATTGIWKPKTAPTVNYGNKGVFLKFDNSANMGLDSSGSARNFTTSGTIIQTKDTPNNVFATLNPLLKLSSVTFSNGNNTASHTSTGHQSIFSTIGFDTGKYYFEGKLVSVGNYPAIGFGSDTDLPSAFLGGSADSVSYFYDGTIYKSGSDAGGTFASFTTGDIIGVALDMDNNNVYFSKNGTWQNSGDPTSGSTGTGAISTTAGVKLFGVDVYGATTTWSTNFGNGFFGTSAVASAENPDDGNGIFEYDVPAGYRALCTKSLNAEEYS